MKRIHRFMKPIVKNNPIWLEEKPFELKNPFPELIPVAYDLEVYPNFFMGLFIGPQNKPKLYTSENLDELRNDISNKRVFLIGFNNDGYDDYILKHIMKNPNADDASIYEISDQIIHMNNQARPQWYWDLWNYKLPCAMTIDVFKVPDAQIGLKERGCKRHFPKIQDLPILPGTVLTESEKKDIIKYCDNDVRITIEEWNDCQDHIEVRKELTEMFPGCDVISKHDPGVFEEIITKEYCKQAGLTKKYIKSNIKKPGKFIEIKDCFPSWLHFNYLPLWKLKEELSTISGKFESKEDKSVLFKTIELEYLTLGFGAGGLHSVDDPCIIIPKDDEYLLEIDARGYYPGLIRALELHPEHLSPIYNKILQKIVDDREIFKAESKRLKKEGDEIGHKKADKKNKGLKIMTLSAFGKTGNKWSFVFDQLMFLQITIGGQLSSLMLVEMLLKEEIKIISVNTDGIIVRIKKTKLEKLREAYKKWESLTGQVLEEVYIKKYFRRDVNNYYAIPEFGKKKEKGIFKKRIRGEAQIISKAIKAYFEKGTPIKRTIEGSKDLRDFIFYKHVTGKFKLMMNTKEKGEHGIQSTSRWYHSEGVSIGGNYLNKKGENTSDGFKLLPNVGDIVKYGEMTEKEKDQYKKTHNTNEHPNNWIKFENLEHGKNSVLINDLPVKFPVDMGYKYYIDICNGIISTIETNVNIGMTKLIKAPNPEPLKVEEGERRFLIHEGNTEPKKMKRLTR